MFIIYNATDDSFLVDYDYDNTPVWGGREFARIHTDKMLSKFSDKINYAKKTKEIKIWSLVVEDSDVF